MNCTKGSVGVCDDDLLIVEVVGQMVQTLGYEVTSFHDPAALVEFLDTGGRLDICIVDKWMGDVDGEELIESLQGSPGSPAFILLTGDEVRRDDMIVLVKPATVASLSDALEVSRAR